MAEWHRCTRWWDNTGVACPYKDQEGHEEDDREQDPKTKGPGRDTKIDSLPVPDLPIHVAFDKLRKTVRSTTVKKPQKEVSPIPDIMPKPDIAPKELPGVAAITNKKLQFEGEKWLRDFRARLNIIVDAPTNAPAPTLSTAPSKSPVRATSRSATTVAASEIALTRSLAPLPTTANPWDTGAVRPPQSRQVPSGQVATSRRRTLPRNRGPLQRGIGFDASRLTNYAAAALTGAGAYYLYRRGFGGGGGGTSQTPKFRGGDERGAEWAIP